MGFPPISRTFAKNRVLPQIRRGSDPCSPTGEEGGARWLDSSALHLALHGGEDYELLFTASPRTKISAKIAGVPVQVIGGMKARRKGKPLIEITATDGRALRSTQAAGSISASLKLNWMKLLFVCSGNRLRSATAEAVFLRWTGLEAMSAGTSSDAGNPNLTGFAGVGPTSTSSWRTFIAGS